MQRGQTGALEWTGNAATHAPREGCRRDTSNALGPVGLVRRDGTRQDAIVRKARSSRTCEASQQVLGPAGQSRASCAYGALNSVRLTSSQDIMNRTVPRP